ncbi:protein FAM151B isoform X1 [Oreochromis aureus]|uniref:Menorin-like domain-containing protein n=1 Tax=Oreochromis aureus TaxID=47969 RepID=A0A668VDF9_OREAU|nr:protein FAM151B isoform X1 [Oreochromis aureus]
MKTNLLLSFHRIALILIGCFIFYVLWNLKGAMRDQTLDYFFSRSFITRMDAAEVSWSHAANSRSRLAEALTGPSLMIEADIVMRGRDPKEPIMAHPPDTDSDITLREWLEGVKEYGKGIKLDFKSMEAVSPSLVLLQEVLTEPYRPVWINADIFSGPGGQIGPLQRHTFLSVVTRLPSHTVLSLGWTTGWTAGTDNPGYSWDMVHMMEKICRDLKHPVTFPVRAALLAKSFSQLTWLLKQSDRYTLTVWTGHSDEFSLQDLLPYREEFATSRIYFDLPDSLRAQIISAQ